MRSWNTKEWKSQRKKRIKGQVCQQCGKGMELQIHHTYTNQNLYRIMEKRIVKELVRHKMDAGEIPFQGKQYREATCSVCGHTQKITNTRHKRITCKNCRFKLDLSEVNCQLIKEPQYNLGKTGIRIFIKKYRAEIDQKLLEKNAPPEPDYMNLDHDTVVLCKTCHYALENGYDLCPMCKKNYKKIQDLQCSQCNLKSSRN